MTLAVEPGVLYDWPTHVPMPEGYPPWGTDPVLWREENTPGGWALPDPKDYGLRFTPEQHAGLLELAAIFGLGPQQFVELLQEIGGDFTKIFGYLNNVTRSFQAERESSYAGDEMAVGLILLCLGTAGSGKSQTAAQIMWRDFLARHRAGYLRRHGYTPSDKWWRFGPWNFCADTIDYDQNRTAYPDYIPTVLDDPLTLIDSESNELRKVALANISNLATKQRDRGRTFAVTNVFNVELDPRIFTDLFWHNPAFRVPDRFGYAVRMTRRSTDNFKFAGFYVPASPLLDVGGPLAACPGPELVRMFREIKQTAHARLYTGQAVSRYAMAADSCLAENPKDAVDNCFTLQRLFTWLSPILAAEYGYTDQAVERVRDHIWKSISWAGYSMKRKKATEQRWALYDRDETIVHVLGEDPAPATVARVIREWREKLPLPKERLAPGAA